VEVHRFEDVDDRRHQTLGQGEGRVVLGITADLEHALAELGERDRQVRGGRALADAALAVDGEDLGALDLHVGVELNLHAALPVRVIGQVEAAG